jgi:integrase
VGKCRQLEVDEVVAMVRDGCVGAKAKRNRAFILFDAMTGYRVSEILSLRRRDVLDADGRILPEVTVQARFTKKKTASRTVPIADQARAVLRAWLVEMERLGFAEPSRHLFINLTTGEKLNRSSAWKMVRRSAIRARVPQSRVGVHSLRKSFAAENYDYLLAEAAAGKKIDVLRTMQRLLGHAWLESTIKYLSSLDDSSLIHTVNAAAARFGAAAARGAS